MSYAFDEFDALASSQNFDEKCLICACELVSELAYYYIERAEIDQSNYRAKILVPSKGFQRLWKRGQLVDIGPLVGIDPERLIVVSNGRTIAVAVIVGNRIFIGYRGTAKSYDWRINLNAAPVSGSHSLFPFSFDPAGIHRGFAEEAFLINVILRNKLKELNLSAVKEAYLTGHSLGGAIAAVSLNSLKLSGIKNYSVTFASPKYGTVHHYYRSTSILPIQLQRNGDFVPYLPPHTMGYMDHPNGQDASTGHQLQRNKPLLLGYLYKLSQFVYFLAGPHKIENYRHDLGKRYNIGSFQNEFCNLNTLERNEETILYKLLRMIGMIK